MKFTWHEIRLIGLLLAIVPAILIGGLFVRIKEGNLDALLHAEQEAEAKFETFFAQTKPPEFIPFDAPAEEHEKWEQQMRKEPPSSVGRIAILRWDGKLDKLHFSLPESRRAHSPEQTDTICWTRTVESKWIHGHAFQGVLVDRKDGKIIHTTSYDVPPGTIKDYVPGEKHRFGEQLAQLVEEIEEAGRARAAR